MDEVLNYSMNEMAGADFDCSCGRHHTLAVSYTHLIEEDLLHEVIDKYFIRDTIIQMDTQDVTYYLHNDEEFFKYFCRLFSLPMEWYAPWKYWEKQHISKLTMNYKAPDVFEDFKREYADTFE